MKNLSFAILFVASIFLFSNCGQKSKSPEELRFELQRNEELNPSLYMSVNATLTANRVVTRTRLFGDDETEQRGWKVAYTVKNDASVATFKDVKVLVEFISKTETVIDSKILTKYEFFKPGESKTFSEIIQGPSKDLVNSFRASIQGALPGN